MGTFSAALTKIFASSQPHVAATKNAAIAIASTSAVGLSMPAAAIMTAVLMLVVPAAFAYQVTGPVLEVTDSKIVVEKGKEKWEIARDKNTKVTGELKKGAKVTVQYQMTATSIETKDGAAPAKK